MSRLTDKIAEIARPVVEEEGCSLWDVEYVREAGTWYLRVFIDREGGVSIDDCERVSRRLDPILDEILCEIQENAEAKGLKALISMSGYQPGKVTREDLSQLLYCAGFAAEGNAGTLELTITSSGEKLIFRMNAPQIRLSRMRSLLANQIVHAYGGSLIWENMKDGQTLYAYLNNGRKQKE